MNRIVFDAPVGPLGLEEEGGVLRRLYLPNQPAEPAGEETPVLARGRAELLEYFRGERRAFTVPLEPRGTPFQRRVWDALAAVPWGETVTYGALARQIGSPGAVRAVGQANHRNPLPIFLPCHRVVGADGSLTGYAGGLDMKRFLLELEGAAYGKKMTAFRLSTPRGWPTSPASCWTPRRGCSTWRWPAATPGGSPPCWTPTGSP